MDRHYFLEVQTYQSVNNMGHELGRYVEDKYHHMVVHERDMSAIRDDIRKKKEELEEKFPRSRPFKFGMEEYRNKYGEPHYDISAKPDSQYNDNYVFILRSTVVRNYIFDYGRVV